MELQVSSWSKPTRQDTSQTGRGGPKLLFQEEATIIESCLQSAECCIFRRRMVDVWREFARYYPLPAPSLARCGPQRPGIRARLAETERSLISTAETPSHQIERGKVSWHWRWQLWRVSRIVMRWRSQLTPWPRLLSTNQTKVISVRRWSYRKQFSQNHK